MPPARKCYDCDLKNYKPIVKIPEKGWLEWKQGHDTTVQYEILDKREKAVSLTINTHRPEPLADVLSKKHTRFDSYLIHGIIPSICFNEPSETSIRAESAKILRGTV